MTRYPRFTDCFYALLAVGAVLLASCGKPAPLPTVDGPEPTDLIEGVNGCVVISGHRGDNPPLLLPALDEGLSWFPDGKRLAYVKLIPRQEAEDHFSNLGDFGSNFKEWEKVPAVHVFDTETGKKSFLHLGWHPQVSTDGKNVLVSDFD